MDRKVIFALVLGALFIISMSSVAGGIYWGDSAALSVGDEPSIGNNVDCPGNAYGFAYGNKNGNKFNVAEEPDMIILTGIYWGD